MRRTNLSQKPIQVWVLGVGAILSRRLSKAGGLGVGVVAMHSRRRSNAGVPGIGVVAMHSLELSGAGIPAIGTVGKVDPTIRRRVGNRCSQRCRELAITDRLRQSRLIPMIVATVRGNPQTVCNNGRLD